MSEYIKREDAIAKEEIIITNTGREVCAEKPLTWNERINQMTLEEKAIWLYNMDVCRVSSISIEECNSFRHCVECMKSMLASPYTEGEKK